MSTSDLALLHQWRTRHDARAFNELAARHTPMVYATCRRVLRDESSAEDVTQECFEMLATAKRPPKSQLPAWLHRVATNRSLDKLRTARRRMQREREYVELQKGHDEIEWDDVYTHIDEIIDDLPDKSRHVIIATFMESRSQTAVASELGVSPQAVNKRISRGIETIRTQLRKRGIEVSAAMLVTLMSENIVQAAVPTLVSAGIGKLALAGGSALSPPTGALTGSLVTKGLLALVTAGVVVTVAVSATNKKTQTLPELDSQDLIVANQSAEDPAGDPTQEEDSSRRQIDAPLRAENVTFNEPDIAGNTLNETSKVELSRLASVSGRVVLPDNSPFAGANVRLELLTMNRPRGDLSDTHRMIAEQDGAFTFEGLKGGNYGIQVLPPEVPMVSGKPFEIAQVSLEDGEKKTGLRVVYGGPRYDAAHQDERILHERAIEITQREYDELLKQLILPPNIDEQARYLITQAMIERHGMYSQFTESTTLGERIQVYESARLRVEREVAQFLTPAELGVWCEYEATRDFREHQTRFEIAMIRSNSQLSPENRASLVQILADEFINSENAFYDRPVNAETLGMRFTLTADAAWEQMYGALDAEEIPFLEETLTRWLDEFDLRSNQSQ